MSGIPGRYADQFNLRLPDGMRDRLAEEAKANNRSMNAEIVARLQGSFDAPRTAAGVPLTDEGLALMRAIAGDTAKMVQDFKAEIDRAESVLLGRADQNEAAARRRAKLKTD